MCLNEQIASQLVGKWNTMALTIYVTVIDNTIQILSFMEVV